MNVLMFHKKNVIALTVLWITTLLAMSSAAWANDFEEAERLYADNCAVCHGVDRGGYIGPALNSDETKLTEAQIGAKIIEGGAVTLMPQHPTWPGKFSTKKINLLVSLIAKRPKQAVSWQLSDIRNSLEVLVADESTLPTKPAYKIESVDDLMVIMARGRFAAGDEAKVVFYNGKTNKKVGEVSTEFAPHLMDFHPRQERWAYVRDDLGYIMKIDLYSLKIVRKIRAGLNGTSLAVSRDGRYLAAGSYIPNTVVIMDASTLEPLKLIELHGTNPDGKMVESDSGMITSTPFADYFVIALEQAGQVWVLDLNKPEMPVTKITEVGRHLHDAFLTPDGRHVVVSSYEDNINTVIDLAKKRIVKKIPAGCQPHLGSGAVVKSKGRLLGIGTNIGSKPCKSYEVTVFDMESFEVVKRIPVLGPTESPAAHPNAPYIVVDIVGTDPSASKIQFIDKQTLEVSKTITVVGSLGHSHFPEYTASGDYIYVSAGVGGDRIAGYDGDRLVIYDAHTLKKVKTESMEVPAGVFSHQRARTVVVGYESVED
ncbi:MAG: nitrite reductase [Gammaproteobacteria bacterium]|nr:nitrite reductase [Gammaproteobacteria bacterium]